VLASILNWVVLRSSHSPLAALQPFEIRASVRSLRRPV
jgi:hypothetical protein